MEPGSPILQVDSLPSEPPGKTHEEEGLQQFIETKVERWGRKNETVIYCLLFSNKLNDICLPEEFSFHRHFTGGYQRHQPWLEVRKSGLKVKQESSQFWEFSEEVVQQTSFCRDRSTLGCPCPPWKTHCPHETLPQAPGENATSHLNVTWSHQSDECPGLVSLEPMRVQDRYPPRVLKCPHNYHTQKVIPHTEEGRIDARQSPQKCHAIS